MKITKGKRWWYADRRKFATKAEAEAYVEKVFGLKESIVLEPEKASPFLEEIEDGSQED